MTRPNLQRAVLEAVEVEKGGVKETDQYIRTALVNPQNGDCFVAQKAKKFAVANDKAAHDKFVEDYEKPLKAKIETVMKKFGIDPKENLLFSLEPKRVDISIDKGKLRNGTKYDSSLFYASIVNNLHIENKGPVRYYNPFIYGKDGKVVEYGDHSP